MGYHISVPNEIIKQIEERLQIHEDSLEKDLIDNTLHENEFVRHLYDASDLVTELEENFRKIKRERYLDYLTGNTGDPKVDNRALRAGQIDLLLEGDQKILTAAKKLAEAKNVVVFYENVLKAVKQKSMNINSIIKFRRFMNGEIVD